MYNDYNIKFTYHYIAKLGSRNQPRSAADLLENSELEHIKRTLFFLYFSIKALNLKNLSKKLIFRKLPHKEVIEQKCFFLSRFCEKTNFKY